MSSPVGFSMLLWDRFGGQSGSHNFRKAAWVQTRSTDQGAINVGL